MRSPTFLIALLVGLLIRIAALQLPGVVEAELRASPVSSLFDAAFGSGWHSPALMKLPGLMCAAALTVLLYRVTEGRTKRVDQARWAALAIWLNPALILNGDGLGFPDPLLMLPAVMALLLAHAGAPLAAGVFAGVAAVMAPQGALIVPALVVAVRSLGARLGLVRAASGGLVAAAALLVPLGVAGRWPHLRLGLSAFYAGGDMLSASAANLWWILSWAHGVRAMAPQLKPLFALRVTTEPLPIPKVVAIAGHRVPLVHPPLIAAAVVAVWCLRACWKTMGTVRLALHAALAALTVHVFFVLMLGMREPGQVLEVPLLALAAALEPALRPVFYVVTAVVALNMNLFDGVGSGMRLAIPRDITFIDATVIVSVVNVIALFWLSGLLTDLAAESRGAYSSRA